MTLSIIVKHQIDTIGIIRSPFQQKFAIPRQPGLAPAATATIELLGDYAQPDCVRGLTEFSHIWVLFLFHQTLAGGWKPLVRPPRLGGDAKKGVFATRATYRPNAIGMSVVELKSVHSKAGVTRLEVVGGDWVDGTPVVDIKPYLPYADAVSTASGGFADSRPRTQLVTQFSATARQQLQQLLPAYPQLDALIDQVLAQDPRPAYQHKSTPDKVYGMNLYDLNIKWQVIEQQNHVLSITKGF